MNSISQKKLALANGATISYIESGPETAPVILFVHGLGTYAGSWIKNIEALAGTYRCIAIDLPGHGSSPQFGGDYSMRYFADCLLHFIGTLGLRHLALAGHSMGAQVSVHALLQAPAVAEKLILVAPAGFERFSATEAMLYKNGVQYASMFGDDAHHLKHLLKHSFARFPQDANAMLQDLMKLQKGVPAAGYRKMIQQCVSAMLDEPVYEGLSSLGQPALIVFGEQDAIIPNQLIHHLSTAKLALHVQKRLQSAELLLVPGAGHFVQWEKSDLVNKRIAEFVSKKPAVT